MQRTLEFDGTVFSYRWWRNEQLKGTVDCPLAYDSETEAIPPYRQPLPNEDPLSLPPSPLIVPQVAVGLAYDGQTLVLIHPSKLKDFTAKHRSQQWVGHNFSFDFWVLMRHFREANDKLSQEWLWRMGDENRYSDTAIVDLLLQLGTGNYRMGKGKGRKGSGDDKKLLMTNLAVLSEEFGCGELDKTDPYRLRFAEWLGLSEEEIEAHPEFESFASYAMKDVIVTHRLYPPMRAKAIGIMRKAGWSDSTHQKTYEVRPDALKLFGPLSEYLQVKGQIVLDQLSRTPVYIDQPKRAEMEKATRERYQKCMDELLVLEPKLFKRYSPKARKGKAGQIKLNKKSGLPQMNNGVLKERLLVVAAELNIDLPISKGKNANTSLSIKDWLPIAEAAEDKDSDAIRFLKAWCGMGAEVKLLSFFLSLDSTDGAAYSKYNLLMRTGRTSAQAHKSGKILLAPSFNIQQMPRENDKHPERSVRSLFKPPTHHKWASYDYGYIELCSLAAVMKARFGWSKLAEVITEHRTKGGLDPHQVMASVILNMRQEDFVNLPKDTQKGYRQKAKACFHPDTEVLTKAGWVKITDLTPQTKVAQYWPNQKTIDFVEPLALTERDDCELLHIRNTSVDIRVTPDHRILGWGSNDLTKVVQAEDINDLRGVWNAGEVRAGSRLGAMTIDDVRRVVCIQADGSTQSNRVKFGFKKQRKVERFLALFPDHNESEAPYTKRNGVRVFSVEWRGVYEAILTKDKVFRVDRLLAMPLEWRKTFIEELVYWDGSDDPFGKRFGYTTSVKANADAVQAVCAASGYKASISVEEGSGNRSEHYKLSIKRRDYTRGENFEVTKLEGRHKVYCLSVPSSYVVVRDAGKTLCVGNCNFGYPGGLGHDTFRQYAAQNYGVQFTVAESKETKKKWMDLYPETKQYLSDPTELAMRWQSDRRTAPKLSYMQRKRLSEYLKMSDRERAEKNYSDEELDRFWELLSWIAKYKDDPELKQDCMDRKVTTRVRNLTTYRACSLTGRVRNLVTFTAGANSPFQGSAADGAKLALWNLMRRGIHLLGFVHDSVEVAVPDGKERSILPTVEKVMVDSMQFVLGQNVPVAVDGNVAANWSKA